MLNVPELEVEREYRERGCGKSERARERGRGDVGKGEIIKKIRKQRKEACL